MTQCTSIGAKEPAASINKAEAHWIKRFYIQDYKTLFNSSLISTQVILYKHKYYSSHEYGQFPCQYQLLISCTSDIKDNIQIKKLKFTHAIRKNKTKHLYVMCHCGTFT
jgi:hypothetical protein